MRSVLLEVTDLSRCELCVIGGHRKTDRRRRHRMPKGQSAEQGHKPLDHRVINHWIKLSTICMVDSLVQFDPESPRSNLICLTRFHPARHSGHYCTALTQQQQELEGRVVIHSLWTVSVRVMLNRVINHKALDQAIYNTYMVESLI